MLFHVVVVCLPAGRCWTAGRRRTTGGVPRQVAARWQAGAEEQAGAEQHPGPGTCEGANQKDRNWSRISWVMRNKVKVRYKRDVGTEIDHHSYHHHHESPTDLTAPWPRSRCRRR